MPSSSIRSDFARTLGSAHHAQYTGRITWDSFSFFSLTCTIFRSPAQFALNGDALRENIDDVRPAALPVPKRNSTSAYEQKCKSTSNSPAALSFRIRTNRLMWASLVRRSVLIDRLTTFGSYKKMSSIYKLVGRRNTRIAPFLP